MSDFIDILSPKAYSDLQLANKDLIEMIKHIEKINSLYRNSRTPNQSSNATREATRTIEQQERALERARLAEIRLQQQRERAFDRYEAQLAREGRERMNVTRVNLEANRSYALLRENYNRSVRALQDLVARGRQADQTQRAYNRELRQAQNEFQRYHTRVVAADQAVRRFNYNVENYPMQAVRGIRDLIGAFGIVGGVSLFAIVANDVFKTIKEFQSLNLALLQVVGTQEKLASTQAFLSDISERFGLEIGGLTKQFTQFYVSAKDKVSEAEIKDIFESIAKAGATMGLSVETQERAFLALNQMMSKGTIQAEELRGQLGEALPGAFGIMAKAVGVTEQELGKMMRRGELLANEVLPKFAKQLEITYGIEQVDRIETLTAAQTRLGNAWNEFIISLDNGEGVISRVLGFLLEVSSDILDSFKQLNRSREDELKDSYTRSYNATLKYLSDTKNISQGAIDAEMKRSKMTIEATDAEIKALKNRNIALKEEIDNMNFFQRAAFYGKRTDELRKNEKAIKSLTDKLKDEQGYYDAYVQFIKPVTKATTQNTDSKKQNTKATKEGIDAQENSELAFKTNIQALEKMREKLTIGSSAYQFLTSQIELMRLAQKSLNEEFEAFDVEESVGNIGLKMQTQLPQMQAVVEELEKYKVSLEDLQPLFSDAFNFADVFFQNEIDKYDALINKSNEYYDALIANAEDGSAQEIALQEEKRKAEEKLEEKKRQAEIKAFRFRQLASVAEIAIQTAVAITNAKATSLLLPPGVSDSYFLTQKSIILTSGILQTGVVLAQQPPAYAQGTDYHKGGDAYVGDGGKREVVITPDGKMRITPDETTLIKNMPIGTKVLPDADVFLRNLMLNQAFGMHKEIDNTKEIEKAIERGFKKAKVNNYLSLPKIDLGHHYYKQKGL